MDPRVKQDRLELRRGLQALTDYELGCLMKGSPAQRDRWAWFLPAYQGGLTRDEIDALFFADAARRLAKTAKTTRRTS